MSKVIVFLLAAVMLLSGCVKWKDGSPGTVWDDGLGVLWWIIFAVDAFLWILVWRGHLSPEVRDNPATGDRDVPTGKKRTPVYRVQYFSWAVVILLGLILMYIGVSLSA